MSTHQYAAFMVEGIVQVQTNQDLMARYSKQIGYALARGREVSLAALFGALTTNVVGSYNVEMTADDYALVIQKLGEAGALEDDPEGGDNFALILSWAAYTALLRVEQFVSRDYMDDAPSNAFKRARVGQILGMPVYRSNLLTNPGSGQHDNCAFHREQFALIVQEEVPVQSQYLIRNLADGVVGWNVYGQARVLFPPETPGGGSAVDNRGVDIGPSTHASPLAV